MQQPPQNNGLPLAAEDVDGGFNRAWVGPASHGPLTIEPDSTALIYPCLSYELQRFNNRACAATRAAAARNALREVSSDEDWRPWRTLLVLAVKGTVALDALRLVGAANFVGKPVIDATNPIADAPPGRRVVRSFTSFD